MTDTDKTQHDADCTCFECSLTQPHFLLQRLSDVLKNAKKNPEINLDTVVMRIGDPSIEEGSDSIYVGGIEKGLLHGRGMLLTILSKPGNYDEPKIDQFLLQSLLPGSGITTSLMLNCFENAGTLLHESEFPFLTLEGFWNEGKFQSGDSFQFDYENCTPVLTYSGAWKNDIPCGEGSIFHPDAVYSGDVKFGKKHGSGTQTSRDGRVIEGEWHQGLFHGFMKFKRVDGGINEQEYYQGEEIGPNVQTTYEDEEKIFSTLSVDVEGISVIFSKAWNGKTPIQSYVQMLEHGDVTSMRPVKIEDVGPSKIPEIDSIVASSDVGVTVPMVSPQFSDKNWIMDQSDYVVKDSEDKILGWVKREGTPNQDSSLTKAFIVFPDLGYFHGVVGEDLLPNGYGTYTFPGNFAKISGKWKNGEISEGGIYASNGILYHGDFSNGQPTLDGEYYIQGNAGGRQRATSKKENEELRSQLVDNIGSDVWSKERNIIDWDSKFSKSLSSIISALNLESKSSKIMQLIDADESTTLEFKSSVWAPYNSTTGELIPEAKKNLDTEDSIVKTIAAFCNTEGGTLVIGVQDRPQKRVVGIDADLHYSGKQKDIESFQNSLSEVIRKATKNDSIIGTFVDIRIEDLEGKKICIVDVKQKQWVWVDLKKGKGDSQNKRVFFVRSGPQTKRLSPETQHQWITENESSIS